jgi:hypothetical protein
MRVFENMALRTTIRCDVWQKWIQVPEAEGKKPLERSRRRWKDDIKVYVKEDWMAWTGFLWFWNATSSVVL